MSKIVVLNHLTLDGVMQTPGSPMATLQLADTKATTRGVIIATYRAAESTDAATM